jgi:hypothetical protein
VLPAFSHGVISFVWAVVFGLFILLGGMAVGFSTADSFMTAVVVGAGVFLYVRVYGEDDPSRS